jgi:sugar O-acyltransferase (sialic acid O-acetyltransferase NeuD family)
MNIRLIGAGGHAKVVIATLESMDGYEIDGIYDDDTSKVGMTLLGVPILGSYKGEEYLGNIIVAIGNNAIRKKIVEQIKDRCTFVCAIHPHSVIHPSVQIGQGCVVFAGAILQPDVIIGEHCIINTAATVDHDGILADYVQICPGVHLSGNVYLKEGAFLGTASAVIPGVSIGDWATIGAGSTVIRNILPLDKVAGVPGKSIK